MISDSTCAVVVTFHPDEDIAENLRLLRGQVQGLIVVDNGSPQSTVSLLRQTSSAIGFSLVENDENLGIATALNIGVLRAEKEDFRWVILFDQDSTLTENFIATMVHAYTSSPHPETIGIIVPKYIDKRSGTLIPPIRFKSGALEAAMTSGSFIPLALFRAHGLFEDALFIDAVDYEYSLRLRSKGLSIQECPEATLLHSPGTPRIHHFRGKYLFQTANYGPVRRYYQERNKIWVTRRYWRRFPWFCAKLFWFSFKDVAKTILAEDRKWEKLVYAALGFRDGLRERMGKVNRT